MIVFGGEVIVFGGEVIVFGGEVIVAKRFSAPKLLRAFLVILGRPLQND